MVLIKLRFDGGFYKTMEFKQAQLGKVKQVE